jgi:hypothetical protein
LGTVFLLSVVVLGMNILIGLASGPSNPTPTPNPYPTPLGPRQGVSSGNYGATNTYIAEMGEWAYIHLVGYNGTYPTDHQFVPMLITVDSLPSINVIQEIDSKTPDHDYWLLFNECEITQQCDVPPEEQAARYHNEVLPRIQAGDPNAKLIIGGSTAHECGLAWMTRFVAFYRSQYGQDPPRAGWHFHIYPDVAPLGWQPGEPCPEDSWTGTGAYGANISDYIKDAERVRRWWSLYGSPNDEIWISETGCLTRPPIPPTPTPTPVPICPPNNEHPNMVSYMAAITAYLNGEGRWIDRYAWYTDVDCCHLVTHLYLQVNPTPQIPSDIGVYYSQIQPSAHVPGFLYLSMQPVIHKQPGPGLDSLSGYPGPATVTPSAPYP